MGEPWKEESRLRTLYLDERLSVAAMADELGCSKSTLYHWMDKFGIERRGPAEQRYADKPWRDEATLRELYHDDGHTIQEVADELDTTYFTIHKWMDKLDIERRTAGSYQQGTEPWHDEPTLRELYVTERMTMAEVADHFDCSLRAIAKWLERHDIPTRRPVNGSADDTPWRDEATLRELYHEEKLSQPQIADRLGCDQSVIQDWMSRFDIEPRTLTESHRNYYGTADHPLRDPETLRALYEDEEQTISQIAAASEPPVTESAIFDWIHEFGIETRASATEPKYDTPLDGGYVYYGQNWREQRARRLQRDDHRCAVCGMEQDTHHDEFGHDLHVHHLSPLRSFIDDSGEIDYGRANALENLLTLCRDCHGRWEGIPLRPQTTET